MTETSRAIANQPAERKVIKFVQGFAGWKCSPYGPSTDDPIWGMLADVKPRSVLRWFPDLIATNGKEACLIEVKSTKAGNHNWAIEKMSLKVAMQLNNFFGIRIVYAFVDSGGQIEQLIDYTDLAQLPKRTGPPPRRGSGTPYWLMKRPKVVDEFTF